MTANDGKCIMKKTREVRRMFGKKKKQQNTEMGYPQEMMGGQGENVKNEKKLDKFYVFRGIAISICAVVAMIIFLMQGEILVAVSCLVAAIVFWPSICYRMKWYIRFPVLFLCILFMAMSNDAATERSEVESEMKGEDGAPEIEAVKTGYMSLIPDITYEDAYEFFYAEPTWRFFVSDEGENVVEFAGKCRIGYDLDEIEENNATVYIQFVLRDDDGDGEEESFGIEYVRLKENGEEQELTDEDRMTIIFTPFVQYAEEVLEEPLSDEVLSEIYG